MSPLQWMQSTAPHWTVMLDEVTSDVLTEVGGADGAGGQEMICDDSFCPGVYFMTLKLSASPSPVSPVIPVTGSLAALPAALVAVTVMV